MGEEKFPHLGKAGPLTVKVPTGAERGTLRGPGAHRGAQQQVCEGQSAVRATCMLCATALSAPARFVCFLVRREAGCWRVGFGPREGTTAGCEKTASGLLTSGLSIFLTYQLRR